MRDATSPGNILSSFTQLSELTKKLDDLELKRKRTGDEGESAAKAVRTNLGKNVKVDMRRNPASRRKIDYKSITTNQVTNYCRFKVGDDTTPIEGATSIGSAIQPMDKWSVQLHIDTGRFGEPELELRFKIRKQEVDAEMAAGESSRASTGTDESESEAGEAESKHHRFSARWTPGVTHNGQYVIDHLRYGSIADILQGSHPYDPFLEAEYEAAKKAIKDKSERIKAQLEKKKENLIYMEFTSGSHSAENFDETYWQGLHDREVAALKRLFLGEGQQQIGIWFSTKSTYQETRNSWLEQFATQVNGHIGPFSQYKNAEGYPVLNFDESPPVYSVGDGMFVTGRDKYGNPTGIYNIQPRTSWDRELEFGLCMGMPVIRGEQYARSQMVHLSVRTQQAWFQELKPVQIPGADVVLRDLQNRYFIFVKIIKAEGTRSTGRAPDVGTRIKIQLNNSSGRTPHKSIPSETWYGSVVEHLDGCRLTGTQFCVLATKPARVPKPALSKPDTANLQGVPATNIWVGIVHNHEAADRDLLGVQLMTSPSLSAPTLKYVRDAFMKPVDQVEHVHRDFTNGQKEIFQAALDYIRPKVNDSQFGVISSLDNMDIVTACVGPPGTGKTFTMSYMAMAAYLVGNKVLIVGPSNKCIDRASEEIWKQYTMLKKDHKASRKLLRDQERSFLRLEVMGAELRAMLTIDTATYGSHQKDDTFTTARPVAQETDHLADEATVNETLASFINKSKELNQELLKIFRETHDHMQAVKKLRLQAHRKVANVPTGMTSPWHLFWLLFEDKLNAEKEHNKFIEALKCPRLSEEQLQAKVDSGEVPLNSPLWSAYSMDPVDDATIIRLVEDGSIPTMADRQPSANYERLRDLYIERNGVLPAEDSKALKEEWVKVMRRIFVKVDVLLASANNSGTELLKAGFDARLCLSEESGQVTISGISVPLTSFGNIEGVVFFGDGTQLRPHNKAGQHNEWRRHAEISPLGLLEEKGWPMKWLNIQYRMAPAIAEFPARFFYHSRFTNDPSTERSSDVRDSFRMVTQQYLGGKATEYLIGEVMLGISRVEPTGTSLQNSANCDAIAEFVDRLLLAGADAKEIVILTYYTGEKALVRTRLRTFKETRGRLWEVDDVAVETVDSYQGQQAPIVLLDIVVGKPLQDTYEHPRAKDPDAEDAGLDDETEHNLSTGKHLSAFVADWHRLAMAATRGESGLTIFLSSKTICALSGGKISLAKRALFELYKDGQERGLVYIDNREDTSEEGQRRLQGLNPAARKNKLQQEMQKGLGILNPALKLSWPNAQAKSGRAPKRSWRKGKPAPSREQAPPVDPEGEIRGLAFGFRRNQNTFVRGSQDQELDKGKGSFPMPEGDERWTTHQSTIEAQKKEEQRLKDVEDKGKGKAREES